jgi:hypothetical protein
MRKVLSIGLAPRDCTNAMIRSASVQLRQYELRNHPDVRTSKTRSRLRVRSKPFSPSMARLSVVVTKSGVNLLRDNYMGLANVLSN